MANLPRVCRPQSSPYRWIDYVDETAKGHAHFNNWLRGLPTSVRESVLGEIQARERLASEGRMPPGATKLVEPVKDFPGLVEMKWDFFEAGTRKVRNIRQYHGEPTLPKDALVRLHRHIKNVSPRGVLDLVRAIRDLQQGEMKFASAKFDDWCAGNTTHQR